MALLIMLIAGRAEWRNVRRPIRVSNGVDPLGPFWELDY
jgi:hypothetical protein